MTDDAALLLPVGAWCVALAVDRWLGEPPARFHPVCWMGHYLDLWGQRLAPRPSVAVPQGLPSNPRRAKRPDLQRFMLGALLWLAGALLVTGLAMGIQQLLFDLPGWLAALALGLLLKPMLAWQMLHDEVLGVATALEVSLAAGRAKLAMLVSRDVSQLDASGVRESAIESLAENLNDSLVAPLFWFAVAGLPGAALYRFANTADAMWGYLGVRAGRDWTWAGKWAARADDVLSFIPARLTAGLLCAAAWSLPRALAAEARRTPSPNSGWPMASVALVLGVRLSKPGVYVLNGAGRRPDSNDLVRALRLAGRAMVLTACIGAVVMLALASGSFLFWLGSKA